MAKEASGERPLCLPPSVSVFQSVCAVSSWALPSPPDETPPLLGCTAPTGAIFTRPFLLSLAGNPFLLLYCGFKSQSAAWRYWEMVERDEPNRKSSYHWGDALEGPLPPTLSLPLSYGTG